jgi:ribose 5-phosphate isomerase A
VLLGDVDDLKQAAAAAAVEVIESGSVFGLGSGTTAYYATSMISDMLASSLLSDIVAVPTSEDTAVLARRLGIPLVTLEDISTIDITIDDADELDPMLNLIKGLGGALLREKIMARHTSCQVIVVDESKLVQTLGSKAPLPVEVVPFGWERAAERQAALGCEPRLRETHGIRMVTDEENYILDCKFDGLPDPEAMEQKVKSITGVVENGFFPGLANIVIVSSANGLRTLRRNDIVGR